MSQPPYNPQFQGPPYPQQPGNVGFEQYQQGAPPPYSAGPAPYPPQQYGGTMPPGPYGPGPNTQAQYPAGQQPQTVYVYEQRKKQNTSDEDTCLAMLAGACAMCLCCSLLSD